MKQRSFPWVLAGILVFALAAWGVLGLILAALGLGAVYVASLRLHPRTRHGRCKGSGEIRSSLFPWAFHKCPSPHCQGGRIIRFGARHLGQDHAGAEDARTVAVKKAAKERSAWR